MPVDDKDVIEDQCRHDEFRVRLQRRLDYLRANPGLPGELSIVQHMWDRERDWAKRHQSSAPVG